MPFKGVYVADREEEDPSTSYPVMTARTRQQPRISHLMLNPETSRSSIFAFRAWEHMTSPRNCEMFMD